MSIHIGYFGKLKHRGDFVRFNLPQTFFNVWDDWMQNLLVNGERTHQSQWGEIYNESNSYRFALDENLAGNKGWGGFMFCSSDKVGRKFPFCVAATLPDGVNAIDAFTQLNQWFDDLQQHTQEAMAHTEAYDKFQDTLGWFAQQGSNDTWPSFTKVNEQSETIDDRDRPEQVGVHIHHNDPLNLSTLNDQVIHNLLRQTIGQYSVWSTLAKKGTQHTTTIVQGLPFGHAGLALFDNNWSSSNLKSIDHKALVENIAEREEQTQIRTENIEPVINSDANKIQPHLAVAEQPLDSDNASTAGELFNDEVEAEKLSTGDWSALTENIEEPIIPEIEKLELDDDNTDGEPWVN